MKIVTLSEQWYQYSPYSNTYTDVLPGTTFYTYVETANLYKLINGYNDYPHCGNATPCFRPNDPLARAQMVKLVYLMKEGNLLHSDNYAGSNNWNFNYPPYPSTYMEPRAFLIGSNPSTDRYVGEGRALGWNSSAVNWMRSSARTTNVFIVFHAFNANTNNCSDEELDTSYSYNNLNNGVAPWIKDACNRPIGSYNSEIRFFVDPNWVIANQTGYRAQAGFKDNHTFSYGKHEIDISSYYEGNDQYHKDDMRKFCFFNNVIGWPDNIGMCHQ